MSISPASYPILRNLSPYLYDCVKAASRAGELLTKGFGTDFTIAPKETKNDLVTEYDHASEKLILEFLQERYPLHSFLCEESGLTNSSKSEFCWIIDPLDGTVNFAHGIPLFCISIALAKGEDILCGAIFDPISQQLFFAEKGSGAYLNGKKAQASKTCLLENAFVSTSLSFNLHKNPLASIAQFSQLAAHGFPLRAIGSTALNLAYVASGKLDVYWSVNRSVNAWDMAAGKLLVEEAGGRLTQCDGKVYSLFEESTILATNTILHDEMKQFLELPNDNAH